MKRIIILGLLASGLASQAGTVSESKAVRAIVGESAGDGEQVMLAVACAIRNRGTLHGVYGLNAKHNADEPAWVWQRARQAWLESGRRDVTNGATYFGSLSDVRKGTFTGHELVAVYGQGQHRTYFFR